ncbi:hypothetical protein [Pengzhenrongella sp.]|uniref:hypothetical protein n=1 Tax=Pengzhenrongella sp. TaxID=2888820 RepID=UPI002F949213
MTSFKKMTLTKAQSRWGSLIPEPALEAHVTSWWHLLVSVPLVGLFVLLIVSLSIWSNESRVVPYLVGVSVDLSGARVWAISLNLAPDLRSWIARRPA